MTGKLEQTCAECVYYVKGSAALDPDLTDTSSVLLQSIFGYSFIEHLCALSAGGRKQQVHQCV